MPRPKKRPASRGNKKILSGPGAVTRPGVLSDGVKPLRGLAKGARGKPPRFPGRTGGR